ncbi:DM13 domain-containing protein [Kiloniella antarctica]|uniref:DM13 domain-containing protein n=1 Tax=Kiloniella antarctica TaxID=1550907 RepID=A0ABW5BNM0_9PROT
MKKLFKIVAVAVLAVSTFSFAPAVADNAVSQGNFEGRSDHITTGGVEIVKDGHGGYKVILADNFSLDGAPDPKLAFGKNGIDKSTLFTPLLNKTGHQEYKLPASIDPTKYNEIYVWCEKFDVPLGVANLN